MSAIDMANELMASWAAEADMEWEEDIVFKHVTGPILLVMLPGFSDAKSHLGREGLTGIGDTNILDVTGHVMSVDPRRDLLARCVAFALDRRTRAAASANSSAEMTGSPLLDLAIGTPRGVRGLPRRRATMGPNRPTIQRGTCTSLTGKPSRGGPVATWFCASRLETWRGACSTAASNFSLSCAEGRAYGPRHRLAMLRRN